MRLFLFVAVVIGCGWFAVHSIFSGASGMQGAIGGGLNKLTGLGSAALKPLPKQGSPAPAAAAPASSSNLPIGQTFKPAAGPDVRDLPEDYKASRVYRFQHREPPLAADIVMAQTLGVSVAVDRFTGVVVLVGPVEGVTILESYLREIDTVGGSCAVQAWAVYVDRSAQKGFDLVAAIGAVVEGSSSLVAGSGGLVLNVNSDSLTAALAVICDGSVVEVIQRPHVHLEQSVVSRIESLQEVPIPSTSVSQGIAQTSVEFRKVGLQLEVTPYFFGSDRLRLGVRQSNGLIGRDVKIGENQVPIIETQTVESSVEMTIGQTVILGGVSTLRKKTSKGFLHSSTEISEGSLYVILTTTSSVPRALPVSDRLQPLTRAAVPLVPLGPDPDEWIGNELLPPMGWKKEEREFLHARGSE